MPAAPPQGLSQDRPTCSPTLGPQGPQTERGLGTQRVAVSRLWRVPVEAVPEPGALPSARHQRDCLLLLRCPEPPAVDTARRDPRGCVHLRGRSRQEARRPGWHVTSSVAQPVSSRFWEEMTFQRQGAPLFGPRLPCEPHGSSSQFPCLSSLRFQDSDASRQRTRRVEPLVCEAPPDV